MIGTNTYKEALPESCPPHSAVSITGKFVRFVESDILTENCFKSFAAQGKTSKSHIDPCIWAACSLVIYDDGAEDPLRIARDFAKLKGISKHRKYAAVITLSPTDGVAHSSGEESPHYSFWMYSSFDSSQAKVVPL